MEPTDVYSKHHFIHTKYSEVQDSSLPEKKIMMYQKFSSLLHQRQSLRISPWLYYIYIQENCQNGVMKWQLLSLLKRY